VRAQATDMSIRVWNAKTFKPIKRMTVQNLVVSMHHHADRVWLGTESSIQVPHGVCLYGSICVSCQQRCGMFCCQLENQPIPTLSLVSFDLSPHSLVTAMGCDDLPAGRCASRAHQDGPLDRHRMSLFTAAFFWFRLLIVRLIVR
jgi:hypothetical protein